MVCYQPDLSSHQSTTRFAFLYCQAELIIDLDSQPFSTRLPWHPLGRQPSKHESSPHSAPSPRPPLSFPLVWERLIPHNSSTPSAAPSPPSTPPLSPPPPSPHSSSPPSRPSS